MPNQPSPGTPAPFEGRPRHALACWGGLAVLLGMGCSGGGNPASGDHAAQLDGKFKIIPSEAMVIAGQTFQFSAESPWGSGATWAVLPATGGTLDASGRFMASLAPGRYQIVAMWNMDVRYTATATVTVLPPPPASHLSPGLVQAFGGFQASTNGAIRNDVVAGEPVAPGKAASPMGTVEVRHGFHLPPAR